MQRLYHKGVDTGELDPIQLKELIDLGEAYTVNNRARLTVKGYRAARPWWIYPLRRARFEWALIAKRIRKWK